MNVRPDEWERERERRQFYVSFYDFLVCDDGDAISHDQRDRPTWATQLNLGESKC